MIFFVGLFLCAIFLATIFLVGVVFGRLFDVKKRDDSSINNGRQ